jgi:hypothetical protein
MRATRKPGCIMGVLEEIEVALAPAAQLKAVRRPGTDSINCRDRHDNLSLVWNKLYILPVKL